MPPLDRATYEYIKDRDAQKVQKELLEKITEMRARVYYEGDDPMLMKNNSSAQESASSLEPANNEKQEMSDVDALVRKIEKCEWAMIEANKGVKKLAPVQQYYLQLILAIKTLCENPEITTILLEGKKQDETAAMNLLRQATKDYTEKVGISASQNAHTLLQIKLDQIRQKLEEEINDQSLIMRKGPAAQLNYENAKAANIFSD